MAQERKTMYPTQIRSERIADGTVQVTGTLLAVAGAIALVIWAAGSASPAQITGIAIYAATLIATFLASAIYHLTPWHQVRPVLRRVDHAAIYLKIAGTYTPLVVLIGTGFAYLVLGIVWALAVVGIVLKLFFWRAPGRFGPMLYLIMGWISLALFWSLWPIVPGVTMALIAAGGLIYTLGVPFYAAKRLPYATAIWHGFVVIASACFFAAIATGVAAQV
jgi:hemolysin III